MQQVNITIIDLIWQTSLSHGYVISTFSEQPDKNVEQNAISKSEKKGGDKERLFLLFN